jgi:sec-independent protein translocase protein TatB
MEIMVVSVLALVVFGPDKLPEIARTVGGFIKQLRAMADEVKQEFSDGFDVEDEPDDEKVAALAEDDSDVAHLDDGEQSSDVAEDKDRPAAGTRDPAEHPVAGAIRADREASGRSEGA